MVKKSLIFLCLLSYSLCYSMDESYSITPYFSQGCKDVRRIVIQKACVHADDLRRFLLPVALSSRRHYEENNNIYFMRDVIGMCASLYKQPHAIIALQLKMKCAQDYAQLNRDIIIKTITPVISIRLLQDISSLFNQGADPNFRSLILGETLLMRAVKRNSVSFVKLLIDNNADITVVNDKNRSARDFNFIYHDKKLKRTIISIVDYLLKLETHNALYPNDRLSCNYEIASDDNAKKLRNALYIDRIFEEKGTVFSIDDPDKHPLLRCLTSKRNGSVIKKAVRLAYADCDDFIYRCTPQYIGKFLLNEKAL